MNAFVSGVGRRKIKKLLYDKYAPMLTIRDDHVDNHFNGKFVHIGYFINDERHTLVVRCIYCTFYTFGN